MTREERLLEAINQGYTYNPETGIIVGKRGNDIKCKNTKGYIRFDLYVDGKSYNVCGHQFAYFSIHNETPNEIDHVNRDRSDNRIENLRSVTRSENQQNKDSKGYSFNKKEKKFQASIKINKKAIHLGWFKEEDDAREAYLNAKKIYHTI